jgi:hypothetical protein
VIFGFNESMAVVRCNRAAVGIDLTGLGSRDNGPLISADWIGNNSFFDVLPGSSAVYAKLPPQGVIMRKTSIITKSFQLRRF